MTTKRTQIIGLIEQGHIPAEKINDALRLTKVVPDTQEWQKFILQMLLWLGGLAISFSVMFFIAYNWTELGKFAKFGLVEVLIALSVLAYWKLDKEHVAAKVAMLMASIFLGVLLALYGMTYQTGADPWQLFFNWALLMLPWAILGRFSAIWILWLALLNLSIVLYFTTFGRLFWFGYSSFRELLWILFSFNTIALIIWELAINKWQWLNDRWAVRLLAVASGSIITWFVLIQIFDWRGNSDVLTNLVWMIWMGAMFSLYRYIRHDLFMLAGIALSGIVVVISFVSRNIFEHDGDVGGFLLVAMMIIGMGTGSAVWLRNLHREWES